MKDPRLTAAFVLPPLLPVIGYFSLIAYSSATVPGSPSINLGFYLFWLLALAYIMALVIWLPAFLYLRQRRMNSRRNLVLAGAAAFFLVAAASTGLRPTMIPFCFVSALVGGVYALIFCKIAGPDFIASI